MLECKSSSGNAMSYLQGSVSCSTLLWQDCCPGKRGTGSEDNCSSQRYSVHKRKKILVNVLSRNKRKSGVTLVEMNLTQLQQFASVKDAIDPVYRLPCIWHY